MTARNVANMASITRIPVFSSSRKIKTSLAVIKMAAQMGTLLSRPRKVNEQALEGAPKSERGREREERYLPWVSMLMARAEPMTC